MPRERPGAGLAESPARPLVLAFLLPVNQERCGCRVFTRHAKDSRIKTRLQGQPEKLHLHQTNLGASPINRPTLVELARSAINGSDADLARRIGVQRTTVYDWKKERSPIPDHLAVALARLAGLDPAATLAEIAAAQADANHPEVVQIWSEIARRAADTKGVEGDNRILCKIRYSGARDRRRAPAHAYNGPERRAA
jgi:hypothetical protein